MTIDPAAIPAIAIAAAALLAVHALWRAFTRAEKRIGEQRPGDGGQLARATLHLLAFVGAAGAVFVLFLLALAATEGQLRELLASLPNDYLVLVNQVGNLAVNDADGPYIGYIDFGDATVDVEIP